MQTRVGRLIVASVALATLAVSLLTLASRMGEQANEGTADGIPTPQGGSLEGGLVLAASLGIEVLTGRGEQLPVASGVVGFELSPGGSRLVAATSERTGTGISRETSLLVIDIPTGRSTGILRAGSREDLGPAAWSPDGSRIAYRLSTYRVDPETTHPGSRARSALCVTTPRGTSRRCFPGSGYIDSFEWSPDSRRILFGGSRTRPIREIDVVTGKVSSLLPSDGGPHVDRALRRAGLGQASRLLFPSWSPSGRFLAGLVSLTGGDALYVPAVIRPDGRPVAFGRASTEFPAAFGWSPVDELLAYAQGEAPYRITEARLLDPVTGRDTLLFSSGGENYPHVMDLAWSSSGRRIALHLWSPQDEVIHVLSLTQGPTEPPRRFPFDSGGITEPILGWRP